MPAPFFVPSRLPIAVTCSLFLSGIERAARCDILRYCLFGQGRVCNTHEDAAPLGVRGQFLSSMDPHFRRLSPLFQARRIALAYATNSQ